MKRMTALLTAVLALGVLAGCSEKTPGNAGGTPTTGGEPTSTAPTSSDSSTGLSIDKFVSKPCDLLTSAQVSQLGNVKPGEASTSSLGPLCTWDGKDAIKDSTYEASVTQDKDVADMVANIKSSPVFTDHKVDGVRFVTYDRTDGSMDCTTIIEVSKTDSVTLIAQISEDERASKKPCTQVETVAKLIVTNLRG